MTKDAAEVVWALWVSAVVDEDKVEVVETLIGAAVFFVEDALEVVETSVGAAVVVMVTLWDVG